MLKLGTKVDDMLKAWTKADEAARVEGVKRLGLPENNTAADRARAMGFGDETYYHGSANNIEEFKPNTFFADNGESASSYALDRGWNGGANVTPIRTRVSNPASPDDVKDAAVQTGAADGYDLDATESWEFTTPKTIGAYNPDDPSVRVIDALKGTGIPGHDSAKHWDWDLNNREIDSLQIFNPSDIRSPLAHFNPKYAGIGAGSILSANLMANELDLEHKPKVSAWDSLMNTIGNVNQQQAQSYGDTGAGTFNIAGNIISDPSIIAELGIKGARGTGLGLLLNSGSVEAAENPNFLNKLQRQR